MPIRRLMEVGLIFSGFCRRLLLGLACLLLRLGFINDVYMCILVDSI